MKVEPYVYVGCLAPLGVLALVLGSAAAAGLVAWLVGGGVAPLGVALILGLPFNALAGRRSLAITAAVSEPARALGLAEALFARLASRRSSEKNERLESNPVRSSCDIRRCIWR